MKKAKTRHRAFLQRKARVVVGRGGNLADVFARAAKHLGVEWDGKKSSGYALLDRLPDPPGGIHKVPYKPNHQNHGRKRQASVGVDPTSDEFLLTYAWRALRMRVLVRLGAQCGCCGATTKDGVRMHVDHIKPRRHFPELALSEENLQVLCEVCNHGKGNWDQTDWRATPVADKDFAPVWTTPKSVN